MHIHRSMAAAVVAVLISSTSPLHAATRWVGPPGTAGSCEFDDVGRALAAARDGDEVRIAGSFTGVAASVNARRLTLVGGYEACGGDAPTATTVLDGQGAPARSILTIRGQSEVRIVNVDFLHGDEGTDEDGNGPDDGEGGCIDFRGTGSLALRDVHLAECRADFGGGLSMWGEPAATLRFEDDVTIERSNAQFGGGVFASGKVRGDLRGSGRVADNFAGLGGGFGLSGGVDFDIATVASAGNNVSYLAGNSAGAGAAVLLANDGELASGPARVRIYGTQPTRPFYIAANTLASETLAVFASEGGAPASLCLWDVSLANNTTDRLARILGEGAGLHFNPEAGAGQAACGAPPAELVRCRDGARCNTIAGNGNADNSPNEAMFYIDEEGELTLQGLSITANRAYRHLVNVDGATETARVFFKSTLVADNRYADALVQIKNPATLTVAQSTFVDNDIAARVVLRVGHRSFAPPEHVAISNSIFDQPQSLAIDAPGAVDVTASYLASTDISTLPVGSVGVLRLSSPGDAPPLLTAGYVDRARGNYRLTSGSLLVDYAPIDQAIPRDADGKPRTRDLLMRDDTYGPRDLGAFELDNEPGLVFADDFE